MSDDFKFDDNLVDPSLLVSDSMQTAVDMYEKRIYDLQQLLEISRSLCSTLEYSTLIESILYTCMCQMHVMGAGLFVFDDIDSNSFNLASNHTGMDIDPSVTYSIHAGHPAIQFLSSHNEAITIDVLKEAIGKDTEIPQIESLHPTLIIPLFHKI